METHVSIIFFHYISSQNVEYNSLRYTVGPHCLSTPEYTVCICHPQPPNPPLPTGQPQVSSLSLFHEQAHSGGCVFTDLIVNGGTPVGTAGEGSPGEDSLINLKGPLTPQASALETSHLDGVE